MLYRVDVDPDRTMSVCITCWTELCRIHPFPVVVNSRVKLACEWDSCDICLSIATQKSCDICWSLYQSCNLSTDADSHITDITLTMVTNIPCPCILPIIVVMETWEMDIIYHHGNWMHENCVKVIDRLMFYNRINLPHHWYLFVAIFGAKSIVIVVYFQIEMFSIE